jgi:hypothetical protein
MCGADREDEHAHGPAAVEVERHAEEDRDGRADHVLLRARNQPTQRISRPTLRLTCHGHRRPGRKPPLVLECALSDVYTYIGAIGARCIGTIGVVCPGTLFIGDNGAFLCTPMKIGVQVEH